MPPPDDDTTDWIEVTDRPLSVEPAVAWATVPDCGAVVTFSGVVRDHSEGRPGVTSLEYEVFTEEAVPRLGRGGRVGPPEVALHRPTCVVPPRPVA